MLDPHKSSSLNLKSSGIPFPVGIHHRYFNPLESGAWNPEMPFLNNRLILLYKYIIVRFPDYLRDYFNFFDFLFPGS